MRKSQGKMKDDRSTHVVIGVKDTSDILSQVPVEHSLDVVSMID